LYFSKNLFRVRVCFVIILHILSFDQVYYTKKNSYYILNNYNEICTENLIGNYSFILFVNQTELIQNPEK
jgi:hypothetical protein